MAGEELGVVVRPGSVLHVCGAAEGGSGSEGNGSQVGHREEMFSGGVSWERFYAKEPDGQVVRVCVCVCVCVYACVGSLSLCLLRAHTHTRTHHACVSPGAVVSMGEGVRGSGVGELGLARAREWHLCQRGAELGDTSGPPSDRAGNA